MSDDVAPPRRDPKPPRCPICGKPSHPTRPPFCSERCRLVDLNRWFREGYAIPGAGKPEPDMGGQDDDGDA